MIKVQAALNNLHPKVWGESNCVKGGVTVMFYTSLFICFGMGGIRDSIKNNQFAAKTNWEIWERPIHSENYLGMGKIWEILDF